MTKGAHMHYCPKGWHEWLCDGVRCGVARNLWCLEHDHMDKSRKKD